MDYIEKTGRTVDDAIMEALIQLGTTSDQVDIEVISEGSKGILGLFGAKQAIVRVSKKADPKEIAEAFLKDIFRQMGLFVQIDSKFDEKNQLFIDLSGDNMGILIGKRGSTLDSLQYLVSLVVNKKTKSYIRVKIDTESYRSRRKETLENLAKSLAKKVKTTGKKVSLEPMNPFERRIIHSALQNDRGVDTHSEGDEPYRRVIITPARRK
ncbi:RNA-binding cell elongation regulator Jag/EloR [Vallitalea okinawensis]|uniref:RNA-binding cell elongation regulator Jag/EloR n=1 Tax=Vallitalea okinawensis TaxID=2078660 RepID=UPI000CFDE917|nr:RNA-binding cell elongation regulator Jag/EloR [Vallitalea okinawensis]